MTKKTFSIGEALDFAWSRTVKNFWVLLGFLALYIVASAVTEVPSYLLDPETSPFDINLSTTALLASMLALTVVSWVVGAYFGAAMINFGIRLIDQEKIKFTEIFTSSMKSWKNFIYSFLYGLVASILILIIVALIGAAAAILISQEGATMMVIALVSVIAALAIAVITVRFMLAYIMGPCLIIDRNKGVFEAFTKSGELMKGAMGTYGLFMLVTLGISVAGLLALGVGLLFTIPLVTIANSYIYRKLLAQSEGTTSSEVVMEQSETTESTEELPEARMAL